MIQKQPISRASHKTERSFRSPTPPPKKRCVCPCCFPVVCLQLGVCQKSDLSFPEAVNPLGTQKAPGAPAITKHPVPALGVCQRLNKSKISCTQDREPRGAHGIDTQSLCGLDLHTAIRNRLFC